MNRQKLSKYPGMVSHAEKSQIISKNQPLESEMFASFFCSGTFTVTATPWGWYHKIMCSVCSWLWFLSCILTLRRHKEYKADAGSIRSKVHLWLFPNYFNEPDSASKQLELQEVGGIIRRKGIQWEHLLWVSLPYYHGLHEATCLWWAMVYQILMGRSISCSDHRFWVENPNSIEPVLPTW